MLYRLGVQLVTATVGRVDQLEQVHEPSLAWGEVRPGPGAEVVEAALRCMARWGVTKTTLDDVAKEAGCSRATVYRLFPGGKDSVVEAVAAAEIDRFFAGLGDRLAHEEDLEEVLVAGITYAASALEGHAGLRYLLEHEPEIVLPRLAFTPMNQVLADVGHRVAPLLGPWLGARSARPVAEWVARIVLSYLICPSEGMDLTQVPAARHLVATFVLPGIRAWLAQPDPTDQLHDPDTD